MDKKSSIITNVDKYHFAKMMNTSKMTVFYHSNCTDGAVAAALFATRFEMFNPERGWDMIKFEPIQYGDIIKQEWDIDGSDVVFLDFTPDIAALVLMLKRVRTITVIDHHYDAVRRFIDTVTTWGQKVSEFNTEGNPEKGVHRTRDRIYYYVDVDPKGKTHSAASLLLDFMQPYINGTNAEHITKMVNLAKTYDLWQHAADLSSRAEHLNFYVKNAKLATEDKNSTLTKAKLILKNDVVANALIEGGKELAAEAFHSIINVITSTGCVVEVKNYLTLRVMRKFMKLKRSAAFASDPNKNYKFAHCMAIRSQRDHLGSFLQKAVPDAAFTLTYSFDERHNQWTYSVRSIREDVDCSHIAGLFGGGGHKSSAGFKTKLGIREVSMELGGDSEFRIPFESISRIINNSFVMKMRDIVKVETFKSE